MRTTHEHPPAPGATLAVAPAVRWLRMPLPLALDHVNLWLIAEGDGWAAVDTGFDTPPTRAAWTEVLRHHRLTRLLVTHLHPDHLGLASWLQAETGAPLWMTAAEHVMACRWFDETDGHSPSDLLAYLGRHGLEGPRQEGLRRLGNTYRQGMGALPRSFQPLAEGDGLRIGDLEWRVLAGHGHSPEHASFHCTEAAVLVAGDMLLPRISTHISVLSVADGEDALGRFLASLDHVATLPEDTLVLPSHGLPFRGLRRRVAELKAHHAKRCEALQAACQDGPRSAAELLPALFGRDIRDPFQVMFAMGEAVAHLIHLERLGALERHDDTRVVRFQARGTAQ